MGITNDVGKVGGCICAVSLMLDSLCVSLSAAIRLKPKGVVWGNVVWHDFFQCVPRRPRTKLGADADIVL